MAVNELIRCMREEYTQWPGLALTLAQAARLWHSNPDACATALGVLVHNGFLLQRDDGRFARMPGKGNVGGAAVAVPTPTNPAVEPTLRASRCQLRPSARLRMRRARDLGYIDLTT